jgi:hypothetical protein
MADAQRIIALCGGGISQSDQVQLQAAWTGTGGTASGSYDTDAKAIIFSDSTLTSADKVTIYNAHIACVEKETTQK